MRIIILLVFLFTLNACAVSGDSATERVPIETIAIENPSQTPEIDYLKVPELAVKPLSKRQKRELDSSLPPMVRNVLENAENLEVLGLSSEEKAGIGWYPDLSATIPIGPDRNELLKSFYFDASAGPNPSACFIPRHGLRASYRGKTVEIIICYQCHLFVVKGDFGKFHGGVFQDGSAAHSIFQRVLSTKGKTIE
jgi:hypothetical protein